MKIKDYITLILFTLYLYIAFYLNSFIWIVEFSFSVLFYTAFFYILHIIWNKIRKKEIIESWIYIKKFLFRISILIFLMTSFLWWLSYLSNEIYPAKMPQYILSNWEKEVVFQAMVHIWSEEYYKNVIEDLKNYKENWGVYFFEWVKWWSEENINKFNKALWINFDENLYENFSKLYWVVNQDTREFLWLVNNKDFNVDLNIDDIIKIYEEKTKNLEKTYNEPQDINNQIIKTLSDLNEKELKILVYLNQAILNRIIESDSIQDFATENFANKELYDVILNERNKVVTDEIITSEYDKIFVTYWLLHFEWVFELLKENDTNWEIKSTKYFYPIK